MNIVDSFNEFRREEGLPEIRTVWVICGRCRGDGTLGGYPGVYTAEDFAEDPDLFEDYMAHRRPCEDCGGTGKVREPDIANEPFEVVDAWYEWLNEMAEMNRIEAQERSMGA